MMNFENLLRCNVKAELANRNFSDFVEYVKEGYEMQWFHKVICDKLTAFSKGEIKKLMVFMPPQHGKSELTTRLFPAFHLGKKPNSKMVIASYNSTLASRFNRDIQRVIDSDLYHEVFPKTILNESNVVTVSDNFLRNSEIFEIVGHKGFLKSVGRGGALTGTPIDLGIIDDPIKDRAEAQSLVIRESLWSWYCDVFETRLHNESQQILIQTRWDIDDLAGRLLKRDNDWEIITFEAIKETENNYDPRNIGEALWPKKHSLERILRIKETSPITFDSLYQQNPIPTEGIGILWNSTIIERSRISVAPENMRTIVAIDPATTSNSNSDETGIIVVGYLDEKYYVLDDFSGKYTPNEWAIVSKKAFEQYNCDYYVAEKNQGGDMVKSVLQQADPNNLIKLVTATKGKFTRAEPVYSLYEQNKVFHVQRMPLLERQMITFNPNENSKSPDRVDALVWGISELMTKKTVDIFLY
jgi:phage terminase large subunit-like protein